MLLDGILLLNLNEEIAASIASSSGYEKSSRCNLQREIIRKSATATPNYKKKTSFIYNL